MNSVVITGMGIVSCLGNNTEEVTASLKSGKSGIRFKEIYKEAIELKLKKRKGGNRA